MSTSGFSEEPDNQSSLAVSVNQKLSYDFDLEFLQDLRFKENNSTLKKSVTELSFGYKINKHFRTAIDYRYIIFPEKTGERVSVLGSYKTTTGPLIHQYRLKLQRDKIGDKEPQNFLRHKYTLRYKWFWDLSPYLELEAYLAKTDGSMGLTKQRRTLGLRKKLSKSKTAKIYYRVHEEVNTEEPETYRMLILKFEVELKSK